MINQTSSSLSSRSSLSSSSSSKSSSSSSSHSSSTTVTGYRYTDYPGMWGRLTSQRSSAGVSSFYVPDMSGNMRLLVASDGATVTDTYAYRAFGDSLNVTGFTNNPYRYGGRDGCYYEN